MRLPAALLFLAAAPAAAHDGHAHPPAALPAAPARAAEPFPVPLGGPFRLTDQTGAVRTEADPAGRHQLLFFGYANCTAVCPTALGLMAEVAAAARAAGVPLVPVLITIDPARDTVATLGPALARFGEGFVGLTGSRAELAAAAAGFGVAGEALFDGPEGPVHAHGSLIYLLDPGGRVLAVLPPVLPAETVTRIVLAHARG